MGKLLLAVMLVYSFSILFAQNEYMNGYEKDVAGVNYAYPSPYSYNDLYYLTRANNVVGAMEWETAMVSELYNQKSGSFILDYRIDVTHNP